jgi:hypothetical protein
LLIGGVPQSGGQTTRASGGASHIDSATDPAATTAAVSATISRSLDGDVERTGGAVYDSPGTA